MDLKKTKPQKNLPDLPHESQLTRNTESVYVEMLMLKSGLDDSRTSIFKKQSKRKHNGFSSSPIIQ